MDELTEHRLDALLNAVTSLEKRLNSLEVKVSQLEAGSPVMSAFDVARRDELIDVVDPRPCQQL